MNPRPLDPQSRTAVWPGRTESAGEPLTCKNALKASRAVWASRPALAPVPGSRGSLGRERGYPCQPRSTTTPCPWRSTAASSRPPSCASTPRPTATAPGSSRVTGPPVHPEPGDHGHGARGTARRRLRRGGGQAVLVAGGLEPGANGLWVQIERQWALVQVEIIRLFLFPRCRPPKGRQTQARATLSWSAFSPR